MGFHVHSRVEGCATWTTHVAHDRGGEQSRSFDLNHAEYVRLTYCLTQITWACLGGGAAPLAPHN
jgi:hypothetical protein